MTTDARTPYARLLLGLTLALALAAPMAAGMEGVQTESLRALAERVLTPGALVEGRAD
ncbi:MAG: hypothetical protein HLUCCA09_00345 [Rhodobacteraceae bacterium HLUCCA09]|nr:MAG: hypothetical protein HLUCCA09_00345 [Rhodobacteraceae bacterium HLUCCA09]